MKRDWFLEYFPSGAQILSEINDRALCGKFFVFFLPGWETAPTVSSILQFAGVEGPLPPKIIPLWGTETQSLPGATLRPAEPLPLDVTSVWTDKKIYRAHEETVQLFIFSPFKASQTVWLNLYSEGQFVDRQPVTLDTFGVATLQLQKLQPGRYRVEIDKYAEASFTAAQPRLQTLAAEPIQLYWNRVSKHKKNLVFIIKLTSFQLPLREEVQVRLFDESSGSGEPFSTGDFRPDGAGRIAGELPAPNSSGPLTIEIQSYTDPTKWTSLTVENLPEIQGTRPQFVAKELPPPPEPDEDILELKIANGLNTPANWTFAPSAGPWGFSPAEGEPSSAISEYSGDEEYRSGEFYPLSATGESEGYAIFTSHTHWDLLSVWSWDPLRGTYFLQNYENIPAGHQLQIPIPNPLGFAAFGGFSGGKAWEGWTFLQSRPRIELSLEATPPKEGESQLQVSINTGIEEEIPVFLRIYSDEEEEGFPELWGPARTLLSSLRELFPPEENEDPRGEHLAPLHRRASRQHQKKLEPPSAPPPTTHPGGGGSTNYNRLPPQREEFPSALFCQIVNVRRSKTVTVSIDEPSLQYYRIEALALLPENWHYSSAEVRGLDTAICELTLPDQIYPNDAITGEIVVISPDPDAAISVSLHRDSEAIPLWDSDGTSLGRDPVITGEINQLLFPATQPGHYSLHLYLPDGRALFREKVVQRWGTELIEGWGLKLFQAGEGFQKGREPFEIRPVPPGEMLKKFADSGLSLPPGSTLEASYQLLTAGLMSALPPYLGIDTAPYGEKVLESLQKISDSFVENRGIAGLPPGGSKELCQQLWDLLWLIDLPHLVESGAWPPHSAPPEPPPAPEWKAAVAQMAARLAETYQLSPLPQRMEDLRDAVRVYLFDPTPARREEALALLHRKLQLAFDDPSPLPEIEMLKRPRQLAFAAILYLSIPNYRNYGLQLFNQIFNPPLALESSALADLSGMLAALYASTFLLGTAELDRSEVTFAPPDPDRWESFSVERGYLLAEIRSDRWPVELGNFSERVPLHVRAYSPGRPNYPLKDIQVGERFHVEVTFPAGTAPGDQLQIFLPPALALLDGDREQKKFTVPIHPQTKFEFALVGISTTQTPDGKFGFQHWGVRLFNRENPKRGALAFDQKIRVFERLKKGPTTAGSLGKGWRKIFG